MAVATSITPSGQGESNRGASRLWHIKPVTQVSAGSSLVAPAYVVCLHVCNSCL